MKKHIFVTALASAGIISANGAELDPSTDPPATSALVTANAIEDDAFNAGDYLTGDWGGARTNLIDSGVTPFLYYDSIYGALVSGGIQSEENFTGQAYGGMIFDMDKLAGWDGVTAKLSVINRHGSSISPSVGGIYDPMTINGGQTTWLYDAWVEKNWNDEFALKAGRFSSDQDFANNDLYRYSLSTSINGPIRALLQDGASFTFPFATWGARAKWSPSEEHQFQLGVFHLHDRLYDASAHGMDFDINGDDGVAIMLQYDWNSELFGKKTHAYVGVNQAVGFDLARQDMTGTEDSLTRFYGHIDMNVTDQLQLFTFFTYSPDKEVAFVPIQASFGANYTGLIPCRPDDRTVFFVTYGDISSEAPVVKGLGRRDYEMVYELGHRFQLTPATYIQPSIQYIQNPGGTGAISDAVVLGAWAGITF
ncbi:MAG: carbohydrate porin [Luteolibacter sp.]